MPFMGRDWRSPGETWVKTPDGWERLKILDPCSQQGQRDSIILKRSGTYDDVEDEENKTNQIKEFMEDIVKKPCIRKELQEGQPYCHITLKCTKEVAGANTISEALRRLDFLNAVKDIRRFNYICKLLHLLITQNLTSLSGCATKVLFSMLERVAFQVASNKQNIHILQLLLSDLDKTVKKYYCWGRPLGSTLLWEQHLRTLDRLSGVAGHIDIKRPLEDGRTQLTDLPAELVREILLRLTDYRDLLSSGQAYRVMDSLLHEQHVWRQLVHFHFTRQQIMLAEPEFTRTTSSESVTDWEKLFHHLRKKHGLREEYADYLFLCRHCRCLFWKSYGHPCLEDDSSSNPDDQRRLETASVPLYVPVPPQSFLKFFSL